jgi:caffeoyl-CoA O-methyltransferase
MLRIRKGWLMGRKVAWSLIGLAFFTVVSVLLAQERPIRGGRGGGRGFGGMGLQETPPAGKSEVEKRILTVLDEMDREQRGGMMNVPLKDGRFLRLLAESTGAKHVVELGTSNGYSGIWWCLALNTTGGRLTTFEIDTQRAALARQNFKRAGVDSLVTLVEGDAHQKVTKLTDPIDIVFIDADKEGYSDYFNKLLPLVCPGGLIVAHNITQGMADPGYIQLITTNPAVETLFLNQDTGGISVTLKKRDLPTQ